MGRPARCYRGLLSLERAQYANIVPLLKRDAMARYFTLVDGCGENGEQARVHEQSRRLW